MKAFAFTISIIVTAKNEKKAIEHFQQDLDYGEFAPELNDAGMWHIRELSPEEANALGYDLEDYPDEEE